MARTAQGLKAGNPRAIVALNNPAMAYANSSTDCDDFTTGEVNEFTDIPEDRWRDGKQFHVLSYLGATGAAGLPLRPRLPGRLCFAGQ